MQKFNKKASILIYAIFLSLIISIMFIAISNKINLNLKQNKNISQNFDINDKIENSIKKIEKDLQELVKIPKIWEKEIKKILENIEKNSQISEKINIEIKKNFDFSAENSTIIILPETRLSTQKGTELKYRENGVSQEKIFDFENPIESEENLKKINFKNTWSYSKINIISNKFVIKKNMTYYVYENIWNSNVVKTSWTFKININ